jgi:putative ABC transport system permease protein
MTMRTIPRWVESLAQDLRYGIRNLCRAPALVAVSVLSLALGFGLNLALYAAVNTIFLHQPTVIDPERVVGIEAGSGRQYSYLNYRDLREQGGFTAVTGFRVGGMNRRVGDDLERVSVLIVTDSFFDTLGVRARLGRTFTAGEADAAGRPRLVVLDHPYWNARFGGDPGVIGQTITLDGEPFEIIGVLPASYRSVTGFMTPGAYVPVSALTLATLNDRGSPSLSVLARLPSGKSPEWAQAAATSLGARLERDFPEMNAGLGRPAQVFAVDAMQFRGTPAGFRIFPVVLVILFGLVLLIGSVNVAGLLLARATARGHELTIRAALGASRGRVIQTMLVESLLLSVLGAVVGLLLALIFARTGLPGPLEGLSSTIAPDRRLLVPGLLLLLATTLLCGAVPALRAARANMVTALRKGGLGTTARFNARSGFIVGQVAVSLMLLVVSSLCLRSQMRIFTVDVGFDLEHGAVGRFTAETPRPAAARAVFIDQLVERIERLPGVRSAAVTSLVPLGGDALVASFHPAGRSDIPGTRPSIVSVGPRYFETLAIPVLRGREFTTSDREGMPAVVIVNQTFADTYLGAANPLGQRVQTGGEADAEIVGVVANNKLDTIGEPPKSVLYYPFAQRPRRLIVIARSEGNPAAALPAVRRAMTELDAAAGVSVGTLRDAASTELTMRRVGTQFVGAIGVLGLFLTAIGLYGVVSYLVASRSAELGIRLALGATPGRLHREVLGQAAWLVGGGIALGVPAAMLIAFALKTFLAGLSPLDPMAFASAAAVMVLVALAASYLPARRVARVDPLLTLRE